jgi:adenylylsulfate kinase-like enzyme
MSETCRMVIVITGPIASGKSTIARALARELEPDAVRVAVLDLDRIHDMVKADGATSDEGTWTTARHAAATLANTLVEEGVGVVVAEGSFNTPGDRAAFARRLRTGVDPFYVTLQVSFEEALRRAQRDPTRGASRDPDFLRRYFARAGQAAAAHPGTDLVIDTERTTSRAAAIEIAAVVRGTPATA